MGIARGPWLVFSKVVELIGVSSVLMDVVAASNSSANIGILRCGSGEPVATACSYSSRHFYK
jgi:hypothetical protein